MLFTLARYHLATAPAEADTKGGAHHVRLHTQGMVLDCCSCPSRSAFGKIDSHFSIAGSGTSEPDQPLCQLGSESVAAHGPGPAVHAASRKRRAKRPTAPRATRTNINYDHNPATDNSVLSACWAMDISTRALVAQLCSLLSRNLLLPIEFPRLSSDPSPSPCTDAPATCGAAEGELRAC